MGAYYLIAPGSARGRGPNLSDDALMDIAPALATVMLQRDGDGMVGLLVVRLGVLVGGVVGTGHPTAGQTEPQPHPAASSGRRRGDHRVRSRRGPSEVGLLLALIVPPWLCRKGEAILKVNSVSRAGIAKLRSAHQVA